MRRLYISQIMAFINLVKRTKPNSRRILSVLRIRSQSLIVHGFIPEYKYLLEIAKDLGLIRIKDKHIKLRNSARELISDVDKDHYRLSEAHKLKIADLILRAKGHTAGRLKRIFRKFEYSNKCKSYLLDVRLLQTDELDLIYMMLSSGILSESEGTFAIGNDYLAIFNQLRKMAIDKISAAKLESILRAQKRIGKRAESIVIAHERERLRSLGRYFESELVSLISEKDVTAGYDIASFNGEIPAVEHDRFIEVKGSTSGEFCYYISENELHKAEKCGNKYWLYFVSFVNDKNNEEIIKIPNYFRHYQKIKAKAAKAVLWRVEEKSSISE